MASVTNTSANADLYSKYGVDAAKSTTSTTSNTSSGSKKVEDTFMALLLAELSNQNPMEPMDSSQMVTQMAQMNSLQELQKITATLKGVDQSNQFLTASSLIGKQVSYKADDFIKQGFVSAFSIEKDLISLLVNDQAISIKDIISVAGMEEA